MSSMLLDIEDEQHFLFSCPAYSDKVPRIVSNNVILW